MQNRNVGKALTLWHDFNRGSSETIYVEKE